MTETKTPYTTEAPTWTVAPASDQWDAWSDGCSIIVLPEHIRAHFLVDDHGKLLVNGAPQQTDFLALWTHLHQVQHVNQLAMGNALVYAQEQFGDDLVSELMENGKLSYYTYRQRMSVARKVPPENQVSDVSWSKLRAMAPAPPDVQRQLISRVRKGELKTSPQVVAARKVIMHEPPTEQFAPTAKLDCPICGEPHSWDIDRLQWSECGHCHGKALELRDHLERLQSAVAYFYATGDRASLDSYVETYHVL